MAAAALFAGATLCAGTLGAAVESPTPSDVTTRAFAMVWASDEPVLDATLRVFAEAAGTTDLTGGLALELVSAAFPPALDLGIVKVAATGLSPGTCVYVQTETTTAAGTISSPPSAPFVEVCTATVTTKANAASQVIANDLLRHEVFAPDGVTPAVGGLALVSVPGMGAHPLSAFVGEGLPGPDAVVDLNNLFDASTGASAEVTGGEVVEIRELRGLLCAGLEDHRLLRFRRAPSHEEVAVIGKPVTQLEVPEACFFADAVCDGVVNILDVQRALNVFGRNEGECAFNPDLDVVDDAVINILDVQSILNRLGESEPFAP